MPLSTQLADSLWHCLCPSFSVRSSARAAQTFRNGVSQQPRSRLATQAGQRAHRRGVAPLPAYEIVDGDRFTLKDDGFLSQLSDKQVARICERRAAEGYKAWTERLLCELIEERGQQPNERHYAALLISNTDPTYGSAAEVERLLGEMGRAGLRPDSAVYHAALKVLAVHPDYMLRSRIVLELQRRWLPLTRDGWQWLITGLLRDHQVELALDAIDGMRSKSFEPDPWLIHLTITSLLSIQAFDEAQSLLQYRITFREPISSALWSEALNAAAQRLHHPLVRWIWSSAVTTNFLFPNDGVCSLVLDTAARHGDFRLATDVIRILGQRSTPIAPHHYEALLESYLMDGKLRAALGVVEIMCGTDTPPTDANCRFLYLYLRSDRHHPSNTVTLLERQITDFEKRLKSSSRSQPLGTNAGTVAATTKPSAPPFPTPVLNAVLEAYIHQSCLDKALRTYDSLTSPIIPTDPAQPVIPKYRPSTATFNALLRGCAYANAKAEALSLAHSMHSLKVKPDALTYDRLILTCINAAETKDDWAVVCKYYGEMRRKGWWPRPGTFGRMVRKGWEVGWGGTVKEWLEQWEASGRSGGRLREWIGQQASESEGAD